MTDKHSKKEINAVIKKYLGKDKPSVLKIGAGTGTFAALAVGVDFLVTGGIGTLSAVLVSGTAGAFTFLSVPILFDVSSNNFAGQELRCKESVKQTLRQMEGHLQIAFKKASQPDSLEFEKESFLKLAAEIEQDVKKLSPAFKMVSGGANGFGTDKYEFIVAARVPAPGQKELVTLTQAIDSLNPPPPPPKKQNPQDGFNL